VFDTAQVVPRDDSFLIIAKVYYGTEKQRIEWMETLLGRCVDIIASVCLSLPEIVAIAIRSIALPSATLPALPAWRSLPRTLIIAEREM
jgi:hypothetical protein